MSSCTNFF